MTTDRRKLRLQITAAVVAGFALLDAAVISPGIEHWKERGARIAALRAKVERGRQLCEREAALRERWAAMLRANLPADASLAADTAYQSISHWANASQISLTSLTPTPQWQSRDDGSQSYECRISATGGQAALGRFLYELESDAAVPVNLEECEWVTRDPKGSQITLTARFTFVRLNDSTKP